MSNNIIIYHANCDDGMASAYIANQYFDGDCELIPAQYGQKPPDVNGKNVIIVDFSYDKNTLIEMAKTAVAIKVLDHHKSAAKDLEGLDFCVFNMDKCGARMIWDDLYKSEYPWFIDYIEDRDLGKSFKGESTLEYAKEVSASFKSYDRTIDIWDKMLKIPLDTHILDGEVILRNNQLIIDNAVKNAQIIQLPVEYATIPVLAVNNAVLLSDIGNALADINGIGMVWCYSNNLILCSLRSKGDLDVSIIAKNFGGGGHKNSAGFSLKIEKFFELLNPPKKKPSKKWYSWNN